MTTRIEDRLLGIINDHDGGYSGGLYEHDTPLSCQTSIRKFVMKLLGHFFFASGLMLLYGFVLYGLNLILISVCLAYLSCLSIYLHLLVCVKEDTGHQVTVSNQDTTNRLPSRNVVGVDNPPRYDSLLDLHPELFKFTLPTYEEACRQVPPPPSCCTVVTIAAVHQSQSVTISEERNIQV